MNKTIDAFLSAKEIAIAGTTAKKGNWGTVLMKEISKKGIKAYPINPKYEEIEGVKCYPSVKDLPESVDSLILAVNPKLAGEIIDEAADTPIKRVWLNQGVGDGAWSEENVVKLSEKNMEAVYGFCPMMFFGKGIHKLHYWMRKNLGKTPAEFSKK